MAPAESLENTLWPRGGAPDPRRAPSRTKVDRSNFCTCNSHKTSIFFPFKCLLEIIACPLPSTSRLAVRLCFRSRAKSDQSQFAGGVG